MKTPQYLVRLAAASRDLTVPVFQSVQQNDDATIRHLVPNGWVEIFHSFEVAHPEFKQGLVLPSRNLPPLSLGIAGVPGGWLSLLWQGVVRVFAVVCVLFQGTSNRIEI
jgi:hypothetical protein